MIESFSNWAEFYVAVFGDRYMVRKDGPNFSKLCALASEDRPRIIDLLLAGLDEKEEIAAQALAEINASEAIPSLKNSLAQGATGEFAVGIAQALHSLTRDEIWAAPIVSELSAENWGVRMKAAMALRQFIGTPAHIDALLAAVEDPHPLVRYHSANTLLAYAEKSPLDKKNSLFATIGSREPIDLA